MAKFLNTSATNYYLEELIKNASERLILISPYLKLNDRIKELLDDKNRLKIDVRIVYGKVELQPQEINWLKELTFIRTAYCKNLHAKCYLNENAAIITSLNLYEFSQVNNNEMGIYASRDEDASVYKDTFEEAQRIIRISDEVRMSMEPVNTKEAKPSTNKKPKTPPATEKTQPTTNNDKLSTSKIAASMKIKTAAFIASAIETGYLVEADGKQVLTEKAKACGAELKNSARFGEYFVWPADFRF